MADSGKLSAAAAGSVAEIEESSLQALIKLEQMLPARLRQQVDALRAATVSAATGGPAVSVDTLATVAAAIRSRQRLRFDYEGHDGQPSARQVEPHRLVYTGRRWYLLAFDPGRDDWRIFRADRVRPRLPFGPRFVERQPPEDAATFVRRGVSARVWPQRVRVLLQVAAPVLVGWLSAEAGVVSAVDEHRCVLETGGPSRYEVAAFLASLEVPFTVLDPPEFAEFLRGLGDRFAMAGQVSGESVTTLTGADRSTV